MREIVISFIIGALIGAGALIYYDSQSTATALQLLKLGEAATAETRALQAYQHEEPAIAIWEMRHLIDLLTEHLEIGADTPKSLQFQLFLAHGRLASLYARQHDDALCSVHADKALGFYRGSYPTNQIVGVKGLLELIGQFDSRAQREPKYE